MYIGARDFCSVECFENLHPRGGMIKNAQTSEMPKCQNTFLAFLSVCAVRSTAVLHRNNHDGQYWSIPPPPGNLCPDIFIPPLETSDKLDDRVLF